MSLSRRVVAATVLTILGALLMVYMTSRLILERSYVQLEDQEAITNVERVRNAFDDDIQALLFLALDWSKWDETYHFVAGDAPSYIADNLLDQAFVSLKLNMMAFLNASNEMVFEKGFDLETGQAVPVWDSLSPYFASGSPLLQHPSITSEIAGVIMLPEGPMLIVSLPVLHSDHTGPIGGIMIWGQFLDQSAVEKLSHITSLDVSIRRFDSPDLPPDFQTAQAALIAPDEVFTLPLDQDTVAGYARVDDLQGRPSLILKMEMPRRIYAQGLASLFYFLAVQAVIGPIFAFVMVWLVQRTVLSRLSRLSARVRQIQKTDDLSLHVTLEGNDELAMLSRDIADMLNALAHSRERLQRAHDQLEERVEERTQDISKVNSSLREQIAERLAAEMKLAEARDQALESLRLKTQIVANISHDSRTPLTNIELYTDLLLLERYGGLTPRQHEVIDSIKLNSRQLLALINNMLTEAQMTSGKLNLANDAFDPRQLLDQVKLAMIPLAEQKSLSLITQVAPDFPAHLRGDADRLKQILTNLIDNAIKFTKQGEVTARLYQPDSFHWVMEVTDTGVGISPELHQRIFEPFWQVDGSPTRTVGRGVGLGLSIVKNLAANMNAEIAVKSEIGQGSTFSVCFRLQE